MILRKPSLHELTSAPFVSLRTFRANGSSVQVPIWTIAHGDQIWMRTTSSTFKVKRLRNDPRCELAICNGSGRTILSEFVPARARLLEDEASIQQSQALIRAKYGWQAKLIHLTHKLRGISNNVVVIEVTLD